MNNTKPNSAKQEKKLLKQNRARLTGFISVLAFGSLLASWLIAVGSQSVDSRSEEAHASAEPQPSTTEIPTPANLSATLTVAGKPRTYLLHTPPTYRSDRPMPLVLALHGSGESGQQMAAKTGLSQLADRAGFLVVYPDALNQKWNVSGLAPEDNVAFIHRLIDRLKQTRTIDAQRIYVAGLSNGGILAQKLACESPDQIAAFATVAASLPDQFQSHCQTQTPVSLLMINGTADSVVPWQGGEAPQVRVGRNLSIPPIPGVIRFWRQHNGCPANPKVTKLNDRVEVSAAMPCQGASEVTLITLNGADHIWAGGTGPSQFLDSNQAIWEFFQRHSLQATQP